MNGRFVNDATTLESNSTLAAICEVPGLTTGERVDALYVATVSRKPTPQERDRLVSYVDAGGKERQAEPPGEVFWTLLNCAEFRLNH
jgi:hypothetical protein